MLEFPLERFGVEGACAAVLISPGLTIGPIKARPEQTLGALTIKNTTFDTLDQRIASEIVRDIATLTT